jgi:hypothetical protein
MFRLALGTNGTRIFFQFSTCFTQRILAQRNVVLFNKLGILPMIKYGRYSTLCSDYFIFDQLQIRFVDQPPVRAYATTA